MTTRIQRADLNAALKLVTLAGQRRPTIPILGCCRITAADGRCTVVGTNLEAWISTIFAYEGEAIDIMVPINRLSRILRLFEKDEIEIETGTTPNYWTSLVCGDVRVRLGGLPTEDFPAPSGSEVPTDHSIVMDAQVFRQGLMHALPFVSTEEARYYLNGVYMHPVDGGIGYAATNGHLLVRFASPRPCQEIFAGTIIPRESVAAIIDRLKAVRGDLKIELASAKLQLRIITSGLTVQVKCIDGTFPDYTRVIPAEGSEKTRLTIAAAAWRRVAGRIAYAAGRHSSGLAITMDDPIRLSIKIDGEDTIDLTMPAQISGTRQQIALQPRYLAAALKRLPEGDVSCR